MPFCRECGLEVQPNWKFCPNCNCEQDGQVIVTDGVVAGDINYSKTVTNIKNVTLNKAECVQCNSTGNITLKKCQTCEINLCSDCRIFRQTCLTCYNEGIQNVSKAMESKEFQKYWRRLQIKRFAIFGIVLISIIVYTRL
jgi:hypothetical protein